MITMYPSKFDFPPLVRPSTVPENINKKPYEKDYLNLPLSPPKSSVALVSLSFKLE